VADVMRKSGDVMRKSGDVMRKSGGLLAGVCGTCRLRSLSPSPAPSCALAAPSPHAVHESVCPLRGGLQSTPFLDAWTQRGG
jgi:hypothetical protein